MMSKARLLFSVSLLASANLGFASASATYSGTDTTTSGTWTGKYGADGQLIPAGLSNLPPYASVTPGGSTWTWSPSTTDPRALQSSSNSASRIASTYFGSSFIVDLNLTDGKTHKISLYLCDYDTGGRSQTINILDASTQTLLSTQNFSNFAGGVYATWVIQGHVQIQGVVGSGANAVINGIFFDPSSTSTPPPVTSLATFNGTDTTTSGAWTGKYGSDGQLIPSGLSNVPSYASVTPSGSTNLVWSASTTDTRALQSSSGSSSRIASAYSGNSFTLDLNLNDSKTHQISLYLCDFDSGARSETIKIIDYSSQTVLSTQNVSNFTAGIYAIWLIQGHVQIQVTQVSGTSAVVNGLFFDPPTSTTSPTTASATFSATDTTTSGTWTGKYGADGQLIPAGLSNVPSYASLTPAGATWTWSASTTDTRALQSSSGSASRIASTYYGSGFTIDLNLTDGKTHRISLYLCDFDSGGRSQTVNILDASSQTVLSTQKFSNFAGGVYAIWVIQGHVQIQVVQGTGANALVNGMFFDPSSTTTIPPVTSTATFNDTDTTTSGTWTGNYGADGALIASGLSNIPAYASVTPSGATTLVWSASTTDTRALQSSSGSSSRIASAYSGNSFTIDLNLSGTSTHRISLYLCDFDNGGRSETIKIIDYGSQTVLSTQNVSNFTGGIYATWLIQGHVQIQVTQVTGTSAIVNGLFFDPPTATTPPTTASATFSGIDSSTLGTWGAKYGGDGSLIPADSNTAPAYATLSFSGSLTWVWASTTTDTRALQVSALSSSRIASTYYGNSLTTDLNLTDGRTHEISLYLCDFDQTSRSETITVVDASSQAVLSTQSFSAFHAGIYARWSIQGHVQFQIRNTGSPNAVLNGIFFDSPPAVVLTANAATIIAGATESLTWSSTGATACTAGGGWSGAQALSGSTAISPVTTTTYSLTCTNTAGSTQASATVNVLPSSITAVWVNSGDNKVSQDELRSTNYSSLVQTASCAGVVDVVRPLLSTTWNGSQVSLFGARNEVISFNLVIEAGASTANNVSVAFQSLAGPSGYTISSPASPSDTSIFNWVNRNIELFYVRYLPIHNLSAIPASEQIVPKRFQLPSCSESLGSWTDRPDHDKFYPEIAVPLELELARNKLAGNTGFTIAQGSNQSIWGDIYIPENAPPGVYTGNISVSESGFVTKLIPVSLTVRKFTLPDTPSAPTMLLIQNGVSWRTSNCQSPNVSGGCGATAYSNALSAQANAWRLIHRHKVSVVADSFTSIEVGQPSQLGVSALNGSLFSSGAPNYYAGPGANVGEPLYAVNFYPSWLYSLSSGVPVVFDPWTAAVTTDPNHVNPLQSSTAWESWFENNSPNTERFMQLCDECDGQINLYSGVPLQNRVSPSEVQSLAASIKDASTNPVGSRMKLMSTIDFLNANSEGSVDMFCSVTYGYGNTYSFTPPYAANNPYGDRTDSGVPDEIDPLISGGKELCLYNPARPGSGTFNTEDDGVAPRVFGWTTAYKSLVLNSPIRMFYWLGDSWGTISSPSDLFNNANTFGSLNGNGVLLYPSYDVTSNNASFAPYNQVDAADGVPLGVFASLRLKYWRRGIQDVDYIAAANAINPTATQAIVGCMLKRNQAGPTVLWDIPFPWLADSNISWSINPDDWENARKQLADIIEGVAGPYSCPN